MMLAGEHQELEPVVGQAGQLLDKLGGPRPMPWIVPVILTHRVVEEAEEHRDLRVRSGRFLRKCEAVLRHSMPVLEPVQARPVRSRVRQYQIKQCFRPRLSHRSRTN